MKYKLSSLVFTSIVLCSLLLSSPALSRVVRLDVTSREVAADGSESGRSGPYEVLRGTIHLEVDPENPANRRIVDLKLAPRNSRGMIEFSTEFELHKPVDADRGNRRLLYLVNNRGNKFGHYHFNHQAGGNWLHEQGWSYLWCGWNVDVIESERRLNIDVPVVTEGGKTITGKIYAEMLSYADDLVYSRPFVWGGSVAYPVVDMDTSHARLTKRRYPWDEREEIPGDRFSFARQEDGERVPDPGSLYITDGFEPGWLYELVYTGKDPKVTGLGLAAIRDVVSFFRYKKGDNPLEGVVDHAYAWGHSQSARLLNHYVYQDFNGDEDGQKVLDGLIANCPGGGKGQFNSRFAQTTRHGSHLEDTLYPIDFFPFTTVEQRDPLTNESGDSLELARKSGFLPKMFFVNTTTDYWTRAASLIHTDVTGTKDAGIDPAVRIYFVAGRTHIDSRVGILGRALLAAMDLWVSSGVEPPESVVPRIADGTLVPLAAYAKVFPKIPGLDLPPSYYQPFRLDLGPRWSSEGIADNVPPVVGDRYAALVPQVGRDGIELAGIKLPEIAVPLATYTGWSMRSPSYSNTLRRNRGRTIPLPRTVEQRTAEADPRRSIAERYPNRERYVLEVAENLLDLKQRRLLLDRDVAMLLEEAVRLSSALPDLRMVDEVAVESGPDAALAYFEKLRAAGVESMFGVSLDRIEYRNNARGYELMSAGQLAPALAVFRATTLIYPDSSNAWDSLGECYLKMERLDLARKSYGRSLELDPDNDNARTVIERIKMDPTP